MPVSIPMDHPRKYELIPSFHRSSLLASRVLCDLILYFDINMASRYSSDEAKYEPNFARGASEIEGNSSSERKTKIKNDVELNVRGTLITSRHIATDDVSLFLFF